MIFFVNGRLEKNVELVFIIILILFEKVIFLSVDNNFF